MFIRFPNALVAVRHIVMAYNVAATEGAPAHVLLIFMDHTTLPILGVTIDAVQKAIDKAMSDHQYDVGYQHNDGASAASRKRND